MEHSFCINHAKEFGMFEAVLMKHLHFWIIKNEANGRHFYDGRYWTYSSVKALTLLFPYQTTNQINYSLQKLIEKGIVLTGNYNQNNYDRTRWFAFSDKSISLFSKNHFGNFQNGVEKIQQPIPDSNTDINKDKEYSAQGAHLVPNEKKGVIKSAPFVIPENKEVQNYFIELMGNTKRQNPWPQDKCLFQANLFYDHYQATARDGQWFQKGGQKIKDWKAAARNFCRHALQGVFSASFNAPVQKAAAKTNDTPVATATPTPVADKVSRELQYLYERYLEDESHCTIISIEAIHYDWLKKNNLLSFNAQEAENIKNKAIEYNKEAATNEALRTKLMKCFGVLLMFSKYKAQLKETII